MLLLIASDFVGQCRKQVRMLTGSCVVVPSDSERNYGGKEPDYASTYVGILELRCIGGIPQYGHE